MIKNENDGVWLEYKRHYENWMETETFMHSLQLSEQLYFDLLNLGWKPQQARQVLPNALKTELVMTGFESDWKHFFSLRSPKAGATRVHPDAAYLADMLYDKLNNKQSIVHINVDGIDLYMHENEYKRWKSFKQDMEEKFSNTIKLK